MTGHRCVNWWRIARQAPYGGSTAITCLRITVLMFDKELSYPLRITVDYGLLYGPGGAMRS